jgi:hypothetical protein
MTQIIMGRSVFSPLSWCYPSSQSVLLCRSSLDGSFDIAFVLIFRRCFFLQDLRRRSRPPTLVSTSGEPTSTFELMASFSNQVVASSATKLLLPITGSSSSEPANKKQKKEAQRRVHHVGVQGPFIKSKWSHIPITFSQEDLQLKDYPHNDAMVISCVIKGFLIHNILVDIGNAVDIILAKAFRQMQEPEDKIHDATHPLCGFGGRQIVALGKITMPVTFGFVHNTKTEQIVFDIVDIEYPYNAIIGRGTLNAFEAILHPAYLCMKIPSEQGPIAIHGSQEAARKAEGNQTDSKAIHNIDGAEACEQYKYKREKAVSAD